MEGFTICLCFLASRQGASELGDAAVSRSKEWGGICGCPRRFVTSLKHCQVPIGSLYGIFTYIYHKNQLNVGTYNIPYMDPMGYNYIVSNSRNITHSSTCDIYNKSNIPQHNFWPMVCSFQELASLGICCPRVSRLWQQGLGQHHIS